jgi:hypothetical protein
MKKISKKEKEYEVSWDEKGKLKLKKKSEVKKGKKSRAKGSRFELKVRGNLEEKGWIIDKWSNNVDLEEQKLVKAKRKYNPFKKMLVVGTGFPDFIAFQRIGKIYNIIGVEAKINGTLSKEEKQKCKFLLDKKIFSDIWIGRGKKEGRRIIVVYDSFKEKYYKKVK